MILEPAMRREVELIFCGLLLKDNAVIPEIAADFQISELEYCGSYYGAILQAYRRDGRVNRLSVPVALQQDRNELIIHVVEEESFDAGLCIARLREDSSRRRLRSLGSQLAADAENPEKPLDAIGAELMQGASAAVCSQHAEEDCSLDSALRSLLQQRKNPATKWMTGFPTLDKLTGGLEEATFWICAAYTSHGKTSWATQTALSVAQAGGNVCYVSFEMSRERLARRLLAQLSGLPAGELRGQAFKDSVKELRTLPISLYCSRRRTVEDIELLGRREQMRHGLDVLFVDYLGQIQPSNGKKTASRDEQVTQISAGLQSIAQSLGICVVALSQVNRASFNGGNGKLTASALKDSGALENDCDICLLLERETGSESATFRLAKNRDGGLEDFAATFQPEIFTFRETGSPAPLRKAPAVTTKPPEKPTTAPETHAKEEEEVSLEAACF